MNILFLDPNQAVVDELTVIATHSHDFNNQQIIDIYSPAPWRHIASIMT